MITPLKVRLVTGEETTNISRIISVKQVIEFSNTILDPEVEKNGFEIELPVCIDTKFDAVKKIRVPPCPRSMTGDIITIDEIAMRANNILRVIDLYNSGEKELRAVQKSVNAYFNTVIDKIIGKEGILGKDIIGRRVKMTGRAVIVPSTSKDPEIARLPFKMMNKLKIKDGDMVIIGRDPTIWDGSLDVFIAEGTHEDVIHLHPYCFGQLGADCDGDTVWVMAVPNTPECQAEARANLLGFCKAHTKVFKKINTAEDPAPIDWENNNFSEFFKTSGFSVSPKDILEMNEKTTRFGKSTGKVVAKEAQHIALGLTDDEYKDYIITVNNAMLVQKVYLGPIGAASNKLKLIAGKHPFLLRSACYVSERAQQSLFDFKGKVKSDSDEFDIFEILQIINMTGRYKTTAERSVGYSQVMDRLTKNGFDPEKSHPIIAYIYAAYPLLKAASELTDGITKEQEEFIYKICDKKYMDTLSNSLEMIDKIAEMLGVQRSRLLGKFITIKIEINLAQILDDSFYDVINPFSVQRSYGALLSVRNQILRGEVKDTHITGQVVKMALATEKEHVEQGAD